MIKNKEFCELFRFIRQRNNISARKLSLSAGLSPSYISKVENGTVLPTLESFAKIIKHLNITEKEIAYLIKVFSSKESETL